MRIYEVTSVYGEISGLGECGPPLQWASVEEVALLGQSCRMGGKFVVHLDLDDHSISLVQPHR